MKKVLFLLLATSLFVSCNDSKVQKTDAPKNTDILSMNLMGKVQSFDESSTSIDSTGVSKPDSSTVTTSFDEKGYTTGYVTKDIDGKVKETQTITHYDGGQTKDVIVKNGDGKQTNRWEIKIDDNGKYTEAIVHDSTDKVTSTWKELAENEYGQVTKGTQYKEDGSVMASFENMYDGPIFMGGTGKDSTGKETYRSTIKLNDKKDPAEQSSTTVTKDGTKDEKRTYTYDSYDEQGNWTQRTTMNEQGKPIKITKRTFVYYQK